jgi:hypothetical protein
VAGNALDSFDILAGRIDREDLAALAVQGFVSTEVRPSGQVTYKLRWRRDGRQRVRYLGSDPAVAARVQAAVETLQQPNRSNRLWKVFLAAAWQTSRNIKATLGQPMKEIGYVYHGHTTRLKNTTPVD